MLRTCRVFAVAWQLRLDDAVSHTSFRDAVHDLVARRVAPALAPDRPNLVAFPEHQTLLAALIGCRGEAARAALASGATAGEGLQALAAPYGAALGHYAQTFPEVDSPGQLLLLGLTDTLARAVYGTFATLATTHRIHVAVGVTLADHEIVRDERVALLGDPLVPDGTAYVAVAPSVRNRCLLFGPNGRLLAFHDKVHLVPVERDRQAGFGLVPAELDELEVADLGFARVATVTSKDAWMPDVNDRLEQLGAELLLQPEAFETWCRPGEDLWPPDKFQRGGWWMVQKHPGIHANVTPMLTGRLGDLSFDGQPLVAVPSPAGTSGLALAGQAPGPGWAAVGRWTIVDEPAAALCDPARRPALAGQAAAASAAGGGDRPHEVVHADLTLPPTRGVATPPGWSPAEGPPSTPLSGTSGLAVRPRVVPNGDGAAVAFVGLLDGQRSICTVTVTADGRPTATPQVVVPRDRRPHDHLDAQWSPAITRVGERLHVVFTSFAAENWDLLTVAGDCRGGWSQPVRIDDADRERGVRRERGHSDPLLVPVGRRLVAMWSDLRWPWVLPQIRLAWSGDGGETWSPSWRADGGPAVAAHEDVLRGPPPGGTRGQAFPAAAARDGGLDLAWQELDHEGVPAIHTARWVDGEPATVIRRSPAGRASWRPSLTGVARARWLVWEQADDGGGRQVVVATEDGWVPVDPAVPAGAVQRYPTAVAVGADRCAVVWEDDRAGIAEGRVLLTVVDASGRPGEVRRVDDTPDGAAARCPHAALLADGRLLVVWQDTRDGADRLRGRTV
jgi:predicted amidohydrolase